MVQSLALKYEMEVQKFACPGKASQAPVCGKVAVCHKYELDYVVVQSLALKYEMEVQKFACPGKASQTARGCLEMRLHC